MKRPLFLLLFIFSAVVLLPQGVKAQWDTIYDGTWSNGVATFEINKTIKGSINYADLFIGRDGGSGMIRYIMDNNGAWTNPINNGLTTTNLRKLVLCGNILFLATGNRGVFRTSDSGKSWSAVNSGLSDLHITELALNGADLIACADTGVFCSRDSGNTWSVANNNIRLLLELAINGTDFYAREYNNGVFRSTDSGKSWNAVNNGLTNLNVQALAISGSSLFAGTYDGGVFRSTDSGKSWNAVNNGLTNLWIRALAVSDTQLFAGTYGSGIFRSTDNGANWKAVTGRLPSECYIFSFKVSGQNIFASSSAIIYQWGPNIPSLVSFYETYNTRPQLIWHPPFDSSASVYRIQIDTTNRFISPVISTSTTDTFFSPTSDLPYRRFYWRVCNDADTVSWSPVSSFVIYYDTVPSLVTYTPDPTYNRRPMFKWRVNNAISTYRIEVDTSRQFLSPIFSTTTTDTFFMPANNLPLDTIYWRVGNEAYASVWSGISSVKIVSPIPKIISYYPEPTYNRRPKLKWYKNDSIKTYMIQIDTTSTFISPVISATTTDTFYISVDNLPIGTLFWRVRNEVDPLSWSTVDWFGIIRTYPTLIPYTPNPTTNQRPELKWYRHDSISVFRIQIDVNQQFSSLIVSEAVTDTFFTPSSDLPFDTIYWRVRNEADTLSWSTASSLRIIDTAVQAPTLISATAIGCRIVQLTWQNNSASAAGYVIFRKDSTDTVYHVVDSVKSASQLSYTDKKNLRPLTLYTYQVRAYNALAISDTSNSMQVTTLAQPPAMTWTVVSPAPTGNNLTSIAYGNGRYVAVGSNATILTSADGMIWTSQSGPQLSYVTFGNGQFLAVGGGLVYTSTDGAGWTSHSLPQSHGGYGPGYPASITYGNGLYVVVGGMITVPDVTGGCHTCFWYYNDIYYSSDCINWSATNIISGYGYMRSVVYGNTGFYAVGVWAANIFYSSNGSNWTGVSFLGSGNWVTYGNGQYLTGGAGTIYSKSGSGSWIEQPIGNSVVYNFSAYCAGQYVLVGNTGAIINSPNVSDWALDSSGTTRKLNSVASDGSSQFVAVGDSGTIVVSTGFNSTTGAVKTPSLSKVLKVNVRNSFLTISLPSVMLGKTVDLAVYTASGREVVWEKVRYAAARFTVPVPGLAVGAYVLSAKAGTQRQTVRFIVVR